MSTALFFFIFTITIVSLLRGFLLMYKFNPPFRILSVGVDLQSAPLYYKDLQSGHNFAFVRARLCSRSSPDKCIMFRLSTNECNCSRSLIPPPSSMFSLSLHQLKCCKNKSLLSIQLMKLQDYFYLLLKCTL